jgi:hypothetical protein
LALFFSSCLTAIGGFAFPSLALATDRHRELLYLFSLPSTLSLKYSVMLTG